MRREMLRAKIHRATVTDTNVDYEGSLTLDRLLMDAADLRPFERVDVYDVDNGARFSTYVIEGKSGSGTVCVNGAAARLAARGDKVIVAAYGAYDESEIEGHRPAVILVDDRNGILEASHPVCSRRR